MPKENKEKVKKRKRFEYFFKKVQENLESEKEIVKGKEKEYSPLRALKQITYKMAKCKSVIEDYDYIEDTGKLKLTVATYGSKYKPWYKGEPCTKEIYSLETKSNPLALKELAVLIYAFFEAIDKKRGYIEGWYNGQKMGTKHYVKNLEKYEKELIEKYEKEMEEKERDKMQKLIKKKTEKTKI